MATFDLPVMVHEYLLYETIEAFRFIPGVYRTKSLKYEQDLIAKVWRKSEAPDLDEYKMYVSTMMEINHPNIVKVIDYFEHSQYFFVFYELVENVLATEFNASTTAMRTNELINQIVSGFDTLHSKSLYYSYINPSNIFIDNEGNIKLFDRFFVDHPIAAYIAPEIIKGTIQRSTPESNVWSLGILFYVMITRSLPFGGITQDDMIKMILNGNISNPQPDNPKMCLIVQRMLVAEPNGRIRLNDIIQKNLFSMRRLSNVNAALLCSARSKPGVCLVQRGSLNLNSKIVKPIIKSSTSRDSLPEKVFL